MTATTHASMSARSTVRGYCVGNCCNGAQSRTIRVRRRRALRKAEKHFWRRDQEVAR